MSGVPEGWIAHDGGPCPVPLDSRPGVMSWDRSWTKPGVFKAGFWGNGGESDWWQGRCAYAEDAIIAYKPEEPRMDSPITDVDRQAAADWFELTNSLGIDHTGKRFEEMLRDGSYDGDRHPLVQAFAAHRLRGVHAGIKAAAEVADSWFPGQSKSTDRYPSYGVVASILAIDPTQIGDDHG